MEMIDRLKREMKLSENIPLWLKIAYTAFVAVLVPLYWQNYGITNFLWFSDIALLLTLAALWLEDSLIASMMSVGVLAFETFWNLEFFLNLFTGANLTDLTAYMFDPSISLLMRGLSLFHVFLPVILAWMVYRLGYDSRAIFYQTMLAWMVLPATYFLTEPSRNINWVFGFFSSGRTFIAPDLHLLTLMLAFPLLVYLPTHLILKKFFTKTTD